MIARFIVQADHLAAQFSAKPIAVPLGAKPGRGKKRGTFARLLAALGMRPTV